MVARVGWKWPKTAGNNVVCVCVCVCGSRFRHGWRQPAAGRRRREAGRRLEWTEHVQEAMVVVVDGDERRQMRKIMNSDRCVCVCVCLS